MVDIHESYTPAIHASITFYCNGIGIACLCVCVYIYSFMFCQVYHIALLLVAILLLAKLAEKKLNSLVVVVLSKNSSTWLCRLPKWQRGFPKPTMPISPIGPAWRTILLIQGLWPCRYGKEFTTSTCDLLAYYVRHLITLWLCWKPY